ncbi:MAG TPA: DUF2177 family protein [Burkholderiaceae bacterium]|jgi:uncharacterized membrane protein
MTLRQMLIACTGTAVVFLALDAIWLATMADRLYRPALGALMLERFVPLPAVLFYPLYFVGIVVFAIAPALAGGRWAGALWRGALLGLIAYATYDLTNQATLRGWSWRVTGADLCWGTLVTAVAAAAGARLTEWLGGASVSG